MTTIQMCACGANDATYGARCGPCHLDHLAAQRAQQAAQERARIGRRRAGSRAPAYRPETGDRGHGHGSELEAKKRPAA